MVVMTKTPSLPVARLKIVKTGNKNPLFASNFAVVSCRIPTNKMCYPQGRHPAGSARIIARSSCNHLFATFAFFARD